MSFTPSILAAPPAALPNNTFHGLPVDSPHISIVKSPCTSTPGIGARGPPNPTLAAPSEVPRRERRQQPVRRAAEDHGSGKAHALGCPAHERPFGGHAGRQLRGGIGDTRLSGRQRRWTGDGQFRLKMVDHQLHVNSAEGSSPAPTPFGSTSTTAIDAMGQSALNVIGISITSGSGRTSSVLRAKAGAPLRTQRSLTHR